MLCVTCAFILAISFELTLVFFAYNFVRKLYICLIFIVYFISEGFNTFMSSQSLKILSYNVSGLGCSDNNAKFSKLLNRFVYPYHVLFP